MPTRFYPFHLPRNHQRKEHSKMEDVPKVALLKQIVLLITRRISHQRNLLEQNPPVVLLLLTLTKLRLQKLAVPFLLLRLVILRILLPHPLKRNCLKLPRMYRALSHIFLLKTAITKQPLVLILLFLKITRLPLMTPLFTETLFLVRRIRLSNWVLTRQERDLPQRKFPNTVGKYPKNKAHAQKVRLLLKTH